MKDAPFVHLHNHTEYSLLDGASRVEPLVKLAAEYRMPALAITDHGNMFGAIEFFKKAQAAGVKPIIGCETYVAPHSRKDRTISEDIPESSFHLTLLCETMEGYANLVRLVSAGYLEGFYYRPRIDKELLAQHHTGLIAMSACLKGEVNYYLNHGNYERAKQAAAEYREIMGPDNFLLEVMRIGIPECVKVEAGAEQIGRELGLSLVATNDGHYLHRADYEAHDALLCLQTGKRVKDKARMKFGTGECYLKSPAEMAAAFKDKPEWLENTVRVADRCNVPLLAGRTFFLPSFPRPPGYDTDAAYLKHLALEGLDRRFPGQTPALRERFDHELGVIGRMGFSGYFLIVKDIVDYARRQGIPVGPGRGSAVGSLVLYCLGITDVDPIRYGLIFERFLTAERVSLPDIDIDFADNRRSEVIAYIRQRYGENCVAQIITFGTMQSRAAVRDVGRVLDVPLAEVDRLAKMIPFGQTLAAALNQGKELKALVNSRPDYKKLFEIAARLEGISRHASIHASGVVITPKPLTELVPLYKASAGSSRAGAASEETKAVGDICTQYDMNSLDAIGLLKLDVLGLRTLNVADTTFQLLKSEGIDIDPDRIPLDDAKTYDLLRRTEVVGIFQLESAGMQNLLTRTRPENLEDIMAVISLYRPGPMGNVDLEEYIRRKNGTSTGKLMHPALDEVLKDTHGVIIYQEQVMKIANMVAGFSLAEADKLRRVMGKKIPEEMAPMRAKFLEGAHKQHVSTKVANAIFDLIEPFAGYGFNKSHAAGYAMLSYLTAYLKANYPVEFITATLTSEIGNADKLRKFVAEARRMNLKLLGPDVNASAYKFKIEDNPDAETSAPTGAQPSEPGRLRAIRYGLGGIKNLGQGVCEGIVAERAKGPYKDLTDFIRRTRSFINRKAYESLAMAGALDGFNPDREKLLALLPGEIEKATSARAAMRDRQVSLFGTMENESPGPGPGGEGQAGDLSRSAPPASRLLTTDRTLLHTYEKNAFGFYLSSHPLSEYRLELEVLKCRPLDSLGEADRADSISVAGVITDKKFKKDKQGRDYAIVQLEDLTGNGEVMVFSNALEASRRLVKEDELVLVIGKIRSRGEGIASIWADSVMALSACRQWFKSLTIRIKDEAALDENSLFGVRRILEQHPGRAEIIFQTRQDGKDKLVRVRDLKVVPSTGLVEQLTALPIVRGARIAGSMPVR